MLPIGWLFQMTVWPYAMEQPSGVLDAYVDNQVWPESAAYQ